jgi:catechol 2,3-dioxygenase
VPRRGRIGLYHFAILLPDRAALGRFVAHVSAMGAHAGAADHLVSEALYLNDPDGLGIEVYADRPRASWRTHDREIAMTTAPLDLRSLIHAAGGEPWTGMPAGTTIGHVHFHVNTLDEAEAFYQGALGFDKVVWSYPGALFFSAGGYHHHVGTNTWAAGASAAGADDARLIEWELRLPATTEVAAASASATQAGFDVRRDKDDYLITDRSGVTVRLMKRSNS